MTSIISEKEKQVRRAIQLRKYYYFYDNKEGMRITEVALDLHKQFNPEFIELINRGF